MAKANERDRYKYGVCTNRDKEGKPCPKCESKEVQKTRMGQDFVCEECKEPLRQVPPPKQSTPPGKLIGIIVAAIIILGGGGVAAYFLLHKASPKVEKVELNDFSKKPVVENNDTLKVTNIPVNPKENVTDSSTVKVTKPVPPIDGGGTGKIPYGKWTGGSKNGKPHGTQITFTFTARHLIDSRDPKKRMADPGDYIIGEYDNGNLIQGRWYKSSGGFESIIIGK